MKLVVASDHAGFPLKEDVRAYLATKGHEVIDLGVHSTEPSDYPDSAEAVGDAIRAGIAARVVSLPSWKIFDEQSAEYRDSILLPGVPKVTIEAGATLGWWKYLVGGKGAVIGLDRFGASAPGPIALEKLGISAANVVEHAKKLVKK